jgi:hypothetical protein
MGTDDIGISATSQLPGNAWIGGNDILLMKPYTMVTILSVSASLSCGHPPFVGVYTGHASLV